MIKGILIVLFIWALWIGVVLAVVCGAVSLVGVRPALSVPAVIATMIVAIWPTLTTVTWVMSYEGRGK